MRRLSVSGNLCELLLRLTMLELPVGEQMLDALVRAISLLDLAVAIAKLSTRSLLSSPVWSSTTYGHIGASNY